MFELPEEAINQLRMLFKNKYGINFSNEECLDEGKDLLYVYAFSQGKLHLLNHFVDK